METLCGIVIVIIRRILILILILILVIIRLGPRPFGFGRRSAADDIPIFCTHTHILYSYGPEAEALLMAFSGESAVRLLSGARESLVTV